MYRYKQTIGLDISRTQARLVRMVRRGFGMVIRDAESIPLPHDPAEAARLLRGFFDNRNWRRIPCVVGLQGEGVLLRTVRVAASDARSAGSVVAEEVDRFLGGSVVDAGMDVAETHSREGRQIVFALARPGVVQAHLQVARDAELSVVDCVPSAVALFNASSWAYSSAGAFVAANLEDRETELVLGRGRELRFVRRFPSGRASLLAADARTEPAAGTRLPGWREEFRACLEYYRSHFSGSGEMPLRLILGGPNPGEEAVAAIEAASGLSVRRFSDAEHLEALNGRGEFAVAVGLALAGLGVAPVSLSLLPPAAREELTLRNQLPWWTLTGAALLLALAALVAGYRHNGELQNRRRGELHQQLGRLRREEMVWRQLAGENTELQRRLSPLRAAAWNNHTAEAVLAALTLAKHPNDWITVVADLPSYGAATNAPENRLTAALQPPPGTSALKQFVVEGYTPVKNLSTVREMIGRLRNFPFITAADLLADDRLRADPDRERRWADSGGTLFALEITVKAP